VQHAEGQPPQKPDQEKSHYAKLGYLLLKLGLINVVQLVAALQFQKTHGGNLGDILFLIASGKIGRTEPQKTVIPERERLPLGEMLINEGVISREQLEEALQFQKTNGGRLGDILVSLGIISRDGFEKIIIPERERLPLGKMLINEGVISREQLEQALKFQEKSGGLLGDILITLGMAASEAVYRGLATQNSLGRVGTSFNFQEAKKLPYAIAKQYQICIVNRLQDHYILAALHKLTETEIATIGSFLDLPVEPVLADQHEMDNFWNVAYGENLTDESVYKLKNEMADNSAFVTFTVGQKVFFSGIACVIIIGLILNSALTLFILNLVVQGFYFLIATFKMHILMRGTKAGIQIKISDRELQALNERELPIYTILIPIYKEAQVIANLLDHMDKMDYPKAKLDVRLLLEENDSETIAAIKSYPLPYYCTPLIVPRSKPQTKPKACNYGLIRARGQYVVIYDAEDRPESDQLKKAYLAFRRLPENYICIQSKLNYYNCNDNLLTKWFTQEYSMWFELLLPGVSQMKIPVPLGGTSNHFKVEILKQVGAWDPFNVTEDADLGIRIFKEGYVTAVLDSRTWEEANSKLGNWLRQRSRWIKGYMQTWLVHMRHPVKLYREIGRTGFFGIQAVILGSVLLPLINPWLWFMMIWWYATKANWIAELFRGPIYYMALFLLFIGNFYFVYSNMIGMDWMIETVEKAKKKAPFSYSLVKYSLISPVYWMLMSIASYKAFKQLFTKPYHWEKTRHGLNEQEYSAKLHS
jgi:cellulose synthase/poly-beta-1,6-N-acetylglucosamine synthase-like glycosyltransferase